jgi:hypothetical protein
MIVSSTTERRHALKLIGPRQVKRIPSFAVRKLAQRYDGYISAHLISLVVYTFEDVYRRDARFTPNVNEKLTGV